MGLVFTDFGFVWFGGLVCFCVICILRLISFWLIVLGMLIKTLISLLVVWIVWYLYLRFWLCCLGLVFVCFGFALFIW